MPIVRSVKRGWFENRCDPHMTTITYDKNIECISGHSDAETQEGLNLMLGIADEIDAFKSKKEIVVRRTSTAREPTKSAESILDMLESSAISRFPDVFKNVRISYPRYLGSMIQQLTVEARADLKKNKDKSFHYVSGPLATWEVNPLRKGKEDFAKVYAKDPVMARSRYECKPARAVNPYFRNHIAVDSVFEDVPPPIVVTYKRDGESWVPEYQFAADFKPIVGAVYAMHADLAIVGDKAGVAMSHVVKFQEFERILEGTEGEDVPFSERRPIIKTDFVIAYEADITENPPREIQIRWVRQLAFALLQRGFKIKQLTFDNFQCLSGDTKIPLLDGTTKTMKELVGSEPFWVYSIKDGRIMPGKCTKAWKTGTRNDMVEVELDNGETIKATSDHLFMLRDGTYEQAAQLQPGYSLMPLYRDHKKTSPHSSFYETLYHPEPDGSGKHWRFTHSMVSHYCYGKLPKGSVTHHKDCNPLNNNPDNLVQLTSAEHMALHRRLDSQFTELWKDPEWSKSHKIIIANAQRKLLTGKKGRDAKHYNHNISIDDIDRVCREMMSPGVEYSYCVIAARLGCSQGIIYNRIREAGFKSWIEFKRQYCPQTKAAQATARYKARQRAKLGDEEYLKLHNHKVVAVRVIEPEDVYDLQVEEHHNFAVAAGVFVHNSKDSMQILMSRGITSKRVSTDLTSEPWRNLRDVIYDGRLTCPKNNMLREELLALTKLPNGRVDHPSDSSKDCADAFACSVQGAVEVGGQEDSEHREAHYGNATFMVGPPIGSLAGVPRDMEGGSPSMGAEHSYWLNLPRT